MKKRNTLVLILLIILQHSSYGMQGKRSLSRNDLKRERTELLELPSERPEKKDKIVKTVHHLRWQEALIEGTNFRTLTPREDIKQVTVEVDPIVKAVYEDNVDLLKQILAHESPDVFSTSPHLIDGLPHAANLFEVGAARCSVKCLTFFRKLLTMPQPEVSLIKLSCYTLSLQQNEHAVPFEHPDIDVLARAASGQMWHIYAHTMPSLRRLFELSQKSAYALARNAGNLNLARLLTPIPKK